MLPISLSVCRPHLLIGEKTHIRHFGLLFPSINFNIPPFPLPFTLSLPVSSARRIMRKLALGIPGRRWHGAPSVPAETRERSFTGIGPVQTHRLGRMGKGGWGGLEVSARCSPLHTAPPTQRRDGVERALTSVRACAHMHAHWRVESLDRKQLPAR